MKKRIFFFAYNFSLVTLCFAQVEIEWQKCYGGSDNDMANSLQQTSDGGYIIAGEALSNDGNVNGNHGNFDYWLVKTDSIGNLQWQKCFGGSGYDRASSVQQTSDGGYIAAGRAKSNNGDVSGNHGGWDYWLIKTDSNGNLQWQKCFGGSGDDWAYSVQLTLDGGYILAGWTNSNDGNVSGNHGDDDYWLVKTDSIGNLQWQKCFGGSAFDEAFSLDQTFDGGYIVAGLTTSNDGDITNNHGTNDYWLVKIDSIGNLQWQKCFGGSNIDVANSIQQTSDGGYIVVGLTSSTDGDVTGIHGTSQDYWLIKTDSTSDLQWQKCFGGFDNDVAYSVEQTSNGGYVVAGAIFSYNGDVTNSHGGLDYWLVKTDNTGNVQWQQCFGASTRDEVHAVHQTSGDGFIMVGETNSNNWDVIGNHGMRDYWVVKFTENFNSITGRLFIDANSNGIYDVGEPLVNHIGVYELNTNKFSFSQSTGVYYLNVLDSGNFTVFPNGINYYTTVPTTHAAYFPVINQTDSLNDFAFQPAGVFNDLCVKITPLGNFRAGFNASYMINYENVGTTTLSPTVIFFPDNDVTFVSSNITPASVTADSVVWNVGTLTPFQTGSILVTVNVNVGTPIGTLINSGAQIEPVAGDANTACNYNAWEVFVTGSVDPNAILVDRDTILTTELSNPPFLDYIIWFQNTGNDTAFNARVLNNIPQELDVNSFEFVASSHPMNITYGAHARLMTFTFDNILLSDSNVNEPASHGFVRYRIKPNTTLVAGDSIKNTTFIYFDFNAPVQTDTAVTEIVLPTELEEAAGGSGSKQLIVFPNPADQSITISSSLMTNDQCQMTVYDLFGREIFFKPFQTISNPQTTIDISAFSKGVYFIQVTSGERALRAKFVKQ